jgi:hypothetical protein
MGSPTSFRTSAGRNATSTFPSLSSSSKRLTRLRVAARTACCRRRSLPTIRTFGERLEALFGAVGLDGAWGWVVGHPTMVDFIDNVRGGGNTASGELRELVQFRNEAAHGTPANILGTAALLEVAEFVDALCRALVVLVRHRAYAPFHTIGRVEQIGEVIEVFRRPRAVICRMVACTVRVGDQLCLSSDSSCPEVVIRHLQDHGIDRTEITAAANQEVGMRFVGAFPREGARLLRVVPPPAPIEDDYTI